jgi:hypothetical protein
LTNRSETNAEIPTPSIAGGKELLAFRIDTRSDERVARVDRAVVRVVAIDTGAPIRHAVPAEAPSVVGAIEVAEHVVRGAILVAAVLAVERKHQDDDE